MAEDFSLPPLKPDLSLVDLEDLAGELFRRADNVVLILNGKDEDGTRDGRITRYRHNGNLYACLGMLEQYAHDLKVKNQMDMTDGD